MPKYPNPTQVVALSLVKGYRRFVPMQMRGRCAHNPSCSTYALHAIEQYGTKGVWLAAWRVHRCSSGLTSGYDPVPQEGNNLRVPILVPLVTVTGGVGFITLLYVTHRTIQAVVTPKVSRKV